MNQLSLSSITKSFGGITVLRDVSLDVRPGEVHALVGENGAGKSTLMRIAAGVHKPDSGSLLLNGHEFSPHGPMDAIRAGVAMVHQELSLALDVSIAENIFMGREPRRLGFVDWKTLNSRTSKMLSDFGLHLDPSTPVSELSIGCRQVVEILKALASDPKVIIFDEPTSSLEASETALVLRTIRKLAAMSIAVVYISHRMDEVFEVSDRITVLRDGELVGTWEASQVTRSEVVSAMVGRDLTELYPPKSDSTGPELLRVHGFARQGAFRDIDFSLHRGEILGFSGLVGSGRTELMRAVFGADPVDSGEAFIDGKPVRIRSVRDAMDQGIAYLPEERKTQGLFTERSVEDNILCGNLDLCSRGGVVRRDLLRSLAANSCSRLSVKAESIDQEVSSLSGGNQQKVLLARWMATSPKVLIADEPTRGVDVGAKGEIHRMLRDYADQGNGVIIVSSEMPEVVGLCDRIIVLHEGAIAGEVPGSSATEENLISLAVGQGI